MEREFIIIIMEIPMKDLGKMINVKEKQFIIIVMVIE